MLVVDGKFGSVARENSRLWFRAIDDEGRPVGYGDVPSDFEPLVGRLGALASADVRGTADPSLTAAIDRVISPAGHLRVFYGGQTEPGSAVVNFVSALKVIYLPFTIIPLLAAVIAVPLIVRRSLAGLDSTTERAALIDLDTRGTRLSPEGVVDEIRPLVTATNGAFVRLDEGHERRQRFLTNAAHELRTPIAILQTRIESMAEGPERARLLGDVARLAATAEQLLNIQRMEQEDIRLSHLDLVALCRAVVADLAPLAIGAGCDLSLSSETPRVLVEANGASLGRAVSNLVMNAVEHGGAGTVGVEVFADGSVEVTDEGPGIVEQHRLRVFEPFFRVRPRTHGAGLGLSLVQQIALRHGGDVKILDREKGARFRRTLRLARAAVG